MTTTKKGARIPKGYYIDARTGHYKVKLMHNGKWMYIGTAHTEEAAQQMYNEARALYPREKAGQKPTLKFSKSKGKNYDFTGTPWYGL